MIGQPVRLRRHGPVQVAGFTKEVDAAVIEPQLQIVSSAIQHHTIESAFACLHFQPDRRSETPWPKRSQECDKFSHRFRVHLIAGHAGARQSPANQFG
jgi:hypothetical protein